MEVTLAVACDYAFRSDVGKLNILGIFQELAPPELPFALPQMYVVVAYEASAAEVGQQKQIRTTLMAADGSRVLDLEVGIVVQPPSRPGSLTYLNSIFGLSQVVFPNPGDYAFHILIGGEDKSRIPLHVHQPQQPQQLPPEQPPQPPGGPNV